MTSLSEVYEPDAEFQTSLRRLYAGVGLFLLGALLVILGIVTATTNLVVDGPLWVARELAGVFAGLGVPAVFVGIFTVLPAKRQTRATALIGASIAVLGVALFVHAFPCQWSGSTCGEGLADLTLPTVGTYFLGTIVTFWTLFVSVANFKARNSPGGTVTMKVTRQGETRIVEVPRSEVSGLGGVGFLGTTPDGDVETQTNRSSSSSSPSSLSSGGLADPTVSDGGATADDITPLRETGSASTGSNGLGETSGVDRIGPGSSSPDRYCGSCEHFEYVRTDQGMMPYCAHHDDLMDDMDACADWSSR